MVRLSASSLSAAIPNSCVSVIWMAAPSLSLFRSRRSDRGCDRPEKDSSHGRWNRGGVRPVVMAGQCPDDLGGRPLQIAVIVALATSVAVLLNGLAVVNAQTAVSAILVATLHVPG